MLRILATAESRVGITHLLALCPPSGSSGSWVLVVVRRELNALDEVRLTLPAYFPWIASRRSVIVGWMNDP